MPGIVTEYHQLFRETMVQNAAKQRALRGDSDMALFLDPQLLQMPLRSKDAWRGLRRDGCAVAAESFADCQARLCMGSVSKTTPSMSKITAWILFTGFLRCGSASHGMPRGPCLENHDPKNQQGRNPVRCGDGEAGCQESGQ